MRPVVAMYRVKEGPKDYHFGSDVSLPAGRYDITVRIGKEAVTFQDVVLRAVGASSASATMSGGTSGM